MIIIIETIRRILSSFPNLAAKKLGRVIELKFSVSTLRSNAITHQEKIIPAIQPIAVQISRNPAASAAPGNPNRSQADSPDALSEKATTQGLSLRPAYILVILLKLY